ncbi:MAG: glycosyltransferase family 2 protein [Brevinematales bacterium]|jgi:glycosyltransferase involved in cell wall biosynthesis
MPGKDVTISIVVPMYNESENIEKFYATLAGVLEGTGESFEIICVNDGSKDDTLDRLVELSGKDKRVKVVDFSRNFGKEIALSAGLDFSSGSAVIPIDADLQDPPELIPELVRKWREGFDVVTARRIKRKGETWLKKSTAILFYKIFKAFTSFDIEENTGDFRLLDRKVVEALKELKEAHRYMKGLFFWVGFRQCSVTFERDPRFSGKSKLNYGKLINLAVEGLTSFSYIPLRAASYMGIIISFLSFCYAAFIIVKKLVSGDPVQGYASMTAIILFLGGIQLLTIGIIGEYIGKIYNEAKRRPLYIVREKYGFGPRGKRGS